MITGIVLGTVGIALIFSDSIHKFTGTSSNLALAIAIAASLSSAAGMVYSKTSLDKQDKPLYGAAIQLLAAGTFMIVVSLVCDNYTILRPPTLKIIGILAFLIVIGSILAYSCLLYALTKLPVSICSVYVYVNPIIALIIGIIFLEESVTTMNLLALVVITCAVYCIKTSSREIGFDKK